MKPVLLAFATLSALSLPLVVHAEPAESPARHLKSAALPRWLAVGGLASVALLGAGVVTYELDPSGGHVPNRDVYGVIAVGAAGALIAPSVAEWYSGEPGGLALRSLGVGLGLIGVVAAFDGKRCQQFGDTCYGGSPNHPGNAAVPVTLGAAAYIGGIVYDLVEGPRSIEAANARGSFVVTPTALPTASGLTPGVALAGQF